jgi:predicted XRE-type DNA-binding protein
MQTDQTLRAFAETVSAHIAEAGLTAAEAARQLGVTESELSEPWNLKVSHLVLLALILETQPAAFFQTAATPSGGAK